MKGKGQITLELVVLLLVIINIYAFISTPLAEVGSAASTSVGTAALAVKAVDTIAQKANLVGISGEGARDYIALAIREDFGELKCAGNSILVDFTFYDTTFVDESPSAFGVSALLSTSSESYSKPVDFDLDCDDFDLDTDSDYRACVTFENTGNEVKIKADDHCRWSAPLCQNGVREGSEECDIYDNSMCPGPDKECLPNCKCKHQPSPTPRVCGDGNIDRPDEECDTTKLGACLGPCQPPGAPDECTCTEFCGDGIIQTPNDDGVDEKCEEDSDCLGSDWCASPGDPDECTCKSSSPPPATCFTRDGGGICTVNPASVPVGEDGCSCLAAALASPDCDTVKLAGDILDHPTDCIAMLHDKSLDCDGHIMDGASLIGSDGITLDMVSNALINNCHLTDWHTGINITSSANANNRLENNIVCSNIKDIVDSSAGPNYGDDNTCNTTDNWDDDGTTGCTYTC